VAFADLGTLELVIDDDPNIIEERLMEAVAAFPMRRRSVVGAPSFLRRFPPDPAAGDWSFVHFHTLARELRAGQSPMQVSSLPAAVSWDPHMIVVQDVAAAEAPVPLMADWVLKLVTEGFSVVAGLRATNVEDAARYFVDSVTQRYLIKDELLLSLVNVHNHDRDESERFRAAVEAALCLEAE
jgi:hypothetical protein